ncbi:MAG TPA: hypothetical protein VHN79_08995 [Lacunisphaera sp.]|nr:hypothetical protein [Lacunisphaera sp.]
MMRSGPPSSLPALRQLLAARFPPAVRAADNALATGITAIDAASGGLPRPGLTEVVCTAPSCGSQLLFGQLLQVTREQSLRIALVDRHDAFDPGSWPHHLLQHLVWIRTQEVTQALSAADLLARDANLGVVALDLRHTSPRELRGVPASRWYRVQRAIEPTLMAGIVFTSFPLVPSATLRLELSQSHGLPVQHQLRPSLVQDLSPAILRQRVLSRTSAEPLASGT